MRNLGIGNLHLRFRQICKDVLLFTEILVPDDLDLSDMSDRIFVNFALTCARSFKFKIVSVYYDIFIGICLY